MRERSLGYFDASVQLRYKMQEVTEQMQSMDERDQASAKAILRRCQKVLNETRALRRFCRDDYAHPRDRRYNRMTATEGTLRMEKSQLHSRLDELEARIPGERDPSLLRRLRLERPPLKRSFWR